MEKQKDHISNAQNVDSTKLQVKNQALQNQKSNLMKRTLDFRHIGRALALQMLYTVNFQSNLEESQDLKQEFLASTLKEEFSSISDGFLSEESEKKAKALSLILFSGVKENKEKIDTLITEFTKEKVKLIDQIIMQIAIFEAFITEKTPPKVAINEAIEIAKEFGGENSPRFVNGVLDGIFRKYYKK